MFWASANQTANGTVSSGPKNFSLNGAGGQRVCVYLERTFTMTPGLVRHGFCLVSAAGASGHRLKPASDYAACARTCAHAIAAAI
jgi:hypothetical protein